jgi:hypothetical protein
VKSTNQVQAFHEPPSLRPHCSSAQQWVTPELGPSSTPRQGILTRLRLQGKPHLESGRILPRMPSYAHYSQTLIPHMPVPPGSIHLHKHSPSVLTSLSGPRQQAGSGSLRAYDIATIWSPNQESDLWLHGQRKGGLITSQPSHFCEDTSG